MWAVLTVLARAVLRRAGGMVAGCNPKKKAASQLRPTLGSVNTGPGVCIGCTPFQPAAAGKVNALVNGVNHKKKGATAGGNSLAPGALKSTKGCVDRQRAARELRPLPPHLPDASRRLSRLWGVSRQEACQSPQFFSGGTPVEPRTKKGLTALPVSPCFLWSRRRDLNPQPADYKSAALPIELHRRKQDSSPVRRKNQGAAVRWAGAVISPASGSGVVPVRRAAGAGRRKNRRPRAGGRLRTG